MLPLTDVQEMLSLSLDEAAPQGPRSQLAVATRGVVFYSTPHFGSSMAALGWKLRHVPGASPSPSVQHLAPGPHLIDVNSKLQALHDAGEGVWCGVWCVGRCQLGVHRSHLTLVDPC